MKEIILLLISLSVSNITIQAQCAEASAATMLNRMSNGDGTYSFDIAINYSANGANNSSINFTISVCGGATLLTTNCYQALQTSEGTYTSLIQDPALTIPIGADVCITYEAYNSSQCGGGDCTPVNNEVAIYGSLPVDLLYFRGLEKRFKKVELTWVTSFEEDNDYFVIERSREGETFEPIGQVEGNGTSEMVQLYSFIDVAPLSEENYYRLKQVNYDGSFEYSKTILVEVGFDMKTPLLLAPSVAEQEVELIFNTLPKQNSMIEVFNATGFNMTNIYVEEGVHAMRLDISSYQPGTYYIRTIIGKEFVIRRFVKVRD